MVGLRDEEMFDVVPRLFPQTHIHYSKLYRKTPSHPLRKKADLLSFVMGWMCVFPYDPAFNLPSINSFPPTITSRRRKEKTIVETIDGKVECWDGWFVGSFAYFPEREKENRKSTNQQSIATYFLAIDNQPSLRHSVKYDRRSKETTTSHILFPKRIPENWN